MVKDTGMVNAFVEGAVELSDHEAELVARRKQLLGPSYRLFYERPLHIVRGEGVWLYDAEGRRYLDAYNNVTSIGHCHPRVIEAITRQLNTLALNTRYLHESILGYAEALLATMPDAVGHLMLTCTGSEANDLATRIAEQYTGGKGIIVTETAYHGITHAVSGFSPSLGKNVDLGVNVRTVAAPDRYRTETGAVGEAFEAAVRAAIADLQRHGIRPAMFICDAVFSSDGVLVEPPGFLKGAVDAIHEAGGLYVADEVQSGFGRTGDALWGFARHGVSPDLVTMGKPMGNGYPVAGVAARPEVIREFGEKARYFNTFGGNTVAVEAARAVLETIQTERLRENAREVGADFLSALRALMDRHECIGDVRGSGLFIGVEIVSDRASKTADGGTAGRIINSMRENGILISGCGKAANVLKIRPPLVFTREHADLFVETLDDVLANIG